MSLPIITIARSYGSGGRIIGEKVATLLGIPFYDRALIQITAEKSGFHASVVEHMQHKKPTSLLYTLSGSHMEVPLQDQVFFAQAEVIRELAKEGPCVIVGGCADTVLEDKAKLLKVYIHAPLKERAERTKSVYKEEAKNHLDYVKKMDKKRRAYYDYFSHKTWGKADNYHLSIDSSIGLDMAADLIMRTARQMAEEQE
ncbi:MAG: cytidylate kinase-like family protein [Clostridia bacterium]|nr:cytidylate kinase-like family protein [Clostridia bacterium]